MSEQRFYLTERWSISRGRDTYGYNICTIEAVWEWPDPRQVAQGRCSGGNYDLAGTSLAICLCKIPVIQERLQGIKAQIAAKQHDNGWHLLSSAYVCTDGNVRIDGACGKETVISIMREIGVEVTPNWRRKRNGKDDRIGWFVTVKELQTCQG